MSKEEGPPTEKRRYSARELADLFGMPEAQVSELAERGVIKAQQRDGEWYFRPADIEQWLSQGRATSQGEEAAGADTCLRVIESNDLDHYRAQPGHWNVQANQLSKGAFSSHIRSIQLPGILVYDNRWGAAAQVWGQSPEGWIMLGATVSPEQSKAHWCGRLADRRRFACCGAGQAMHFNFEPGAHDVVILVEPQLLERAMGGGVQRYLEEHKHIDTGAVAGGRLIDLVLEIIDLSEKHPMLLSHLSFVWRQRSRLLRALEDCVPVDPVTRPSLREEAVHRALVWASQEYRLASAANMAIASGVSQRTLEQGFSETLGMTPGRYLKLLRLNGARHALAAARASDLTVTEVAVDWGFTHMGRFSREYSSLFDELPSRTLGKTF